MSMLYRSSPISKGTFSSLGPFRKDHLVRVWYWYKIGPLTVKQNKVTNFIIELIDYFTKWKKKNRSKRASRTIDTSDIINFFTRSFFFWKRHGVPESYLSWIMDNGYILIGRN